MKETWPLWWHLESADQALLMQFQWDTYGYRLEIPPVLGRGHIDTELESVEEIGHLVRQAPSRSRGAE